MATQTATNTPMRQLSQGYARSDLARSDLRSPPLPKSHIKAHFHPIIDATHTHSHNRSTTRTICHHPPQEKNTTSVTILDICHSQHQVTFSKDKVTFSKDKVTNFNLGTSKYEMGPVIMFCAGQLPFWSTTVLII